MLAGKNFAIIENEGIIALDIKTLLLRSGAANIVTYHDFPSFILNFPKPMPDMIIVDSHEHIIPEDIRSFTGKYNIPVIILSDYPDESVIFKKIRNCFYIKKPFVRKEFLGVLNKAG